MNYLLHTNAVSEWLKLRSNPGLAAWLDEVDEDHGRLNLPNMDSPFCQGRYGSIGDHGEDKTLVPRVRACVDLAGAHGVHSLIHRHQKSLLSEAIAHGTPGAVNLA
jgi:hypothetical protein